MEIICKTSRNLARRQPPARKSALPARLQRAEHEHRLEFFSNVADDPTDTARARHISGYVNVTTDANGNVTAVGDSSGTATMIAGTNNFAANFNTSVPGGQYISATATNLATSDTSEFARVVTANLAGLTITPTSGLTTSEDGPRLNSR